MQTDKIINQDKIYDLIIVGAGLSGLTTAYEVQKQNINYKIKILEAQNRIGGRILSIEGFDLGPSWTWPQSDKFLQKLIKELNLNTIPSKQNNMQELRFSDGCGSIIEKLQLKLQNDILELNQLVLSITVNIQNKVSSIQVQNQTNQNLQIIQSKFIIIAVPPLIILKYIQFSPQLPNSKSKIMSQTPTWMSDAIKINFFFKQQFWDSKINPPFYDFTYKNQFVLQFFVAGQQSFYFQQFQQDKIIEDILRYLKEIYGDHVKELFIKFQFINWADNKMINIGREQNLESNYLKIGNEELRTPFLNTILFASTETENQFGHMEGAIQSGIRSANQFIKLIKQNE